MRLVVKNGLARELLGIQPPAKLLVKQPSRPRPPVFHTIHSGLTRCPDVKSLTLDNIIYIILTIMTKVNISISVDESTKEQAQVLAESLGLNLSTLVNAYLKQIVATRKIELSIPTASLSIQASDNTYGPNGLSINQPSANWPNVIVKE